MEDAGPGLEKQRLFGGRHWGHSNTASPETHQSVLETFMQTAQAVIDVVTEKTNLKGKQWEISLKGNWQWVTTALWGSLVPRDGCFLNRHPRWPGRLGGATACVP